jgi:hypothetical protein
VDKLLARPTFFLPDRSLTLRRFGLETALAGRTGQISDLHLCAIPGIIAHWHIGVSE